MCIRALPNSQELKIELTLYCLDLAFQFAFDCVDKHVSTDFIHLFCLTTVSRRRLDDEEDEKRKHTFCRTWCDMWFLLAHSSKPAEYVLLLLIQTIASLVRDQQCCIPV